MITVDMIREYIPEHHQDKISGERLNMAVQLFCDFTGILFDKQQLTVLTIHEDTDRILIPYREIATINSIKDIDGNEYDARFFSGNRIYLTQKIKEGDYILDIHYDTQITPGYLGDIANIFIYLLVNRLFSAYKQQGPVAEQFTEIRNIITSGVKYC